MSVLPVLSLHVVTNIFKSCVYFFSSNATIHFSVLAFELQHTQHPGQVELRGPSLCAFLWLIRELWSLGGDGTMFLCLIRWGCQKFLQDAFLDFA
jgi:hypothetical protein